MADLCEQIRDNDRFARAGHSEQDAVLRSVSQPRVAAVKLPELAQRHGNRRFEESLGEGYIRLVARLAQSIALHNRSLPLAFLLKPDRTGRTNQLLYHPAKIPHFFENLQILAFYAILFTTSLIVR